MNNFDLKKFLVENRLTTNSRIEEEQALTTPDFQKYERNGVIDLGDVNGWGEEKRSISKYLQGMATSEETSKFLNPSRTYEEFTYNVQVQGQPYTVVYRVDSSG